jgi:hypothetical protein
MQLRRFDGSADWEAPARAVDAVVFRAPTDSSPLIERAALTLLGLLAGLALVLSVAAHAI